VTPKVKDNYHTTIYVKNKPITFTYILSFQDELWYKRDYLFLSIYIYIRGAWQGRAASKQLPRRQRRQRMIVLGQLHACMPCISCADQNG
jgi:hypothetical protein